MSNVGGLEAALRALLREVVHDELPAALREVLSALARERTAGPSPAPALTASAGEFLTVEQVATALQVTRATVRRWISGGALRAHAVGPRRLVRVHRADLERFVSSNAATGKNADGPSPDLDAEALKIVNRQRARRA